MDLQDFWQESKRWVLGVVAGLIVFWVGTKVVDAAFGSGTAVISATSVQRFIENQHWFDEAALKQAREENERLEQLAARVREHVRFVPDEEFVLAGEGDLDTYFPKMERLVRQRVLARAQDESVALDEHDLAWPAPVDPKEKEERLVGLDVLQHGALRLIEASETVRRRDPEALGVQVINSFAIDARGTAGGRVGGSAGRGRQRVAAEQAPDLFHEHRVKFAFHADVATLQAWLELLRAKEPSIGLMPDLLVVQGNQVGDPVRVTGTLSAMVFPQSAEVQ